MTSTVAFLEQLRSLGVRLSLTDDKLHIQAPRGALTPELRSQLQERGNEVANYLREMRVGMDKLPPIVRSELISAELVDFSLSFNQQHIWHKHQVSTNPARFNCPTRIDLNGTLNFDAFQAAFSAVINQHPTLRSIIIDGDQEPKQRTLPKCDVPIVTHDLRDEPPARRTAVLQQQLVRIAGQPFNLSAGPLIRAHLFQITDDTYTLLLVLHQMIFDDRSLTIVLRDWSLFYQQILTAFEFDLEPRPFAPYDDESVAYGDYVSWQRWPGIFDTQMAHWREQLADMAHGPSMRCMLPTDWTRPLVPEDRGARETLRLDQELTANLKALSDEKGVSLRMLMLTAYNLLLARLSGQDEIVVGTKLPGRTQVSLANVVGYFANTIVLRTDVRDDPTFVQLLRRVAQASLGAQENQDVPFARMLEALRSEGNLTAGSLVQVFFDMPIQPAEPFKADGIESTFAPIPDPSVLYDLTLNVIDSAENLTLEAVYRHELFSPQRVQEMLRQFEFVLMQAVVAKDRPIASFSLNPNPPKIETHLPCDYLPLCDYVEQHARRNGDKIAVAGTEFRLSYSELNAKANQIANYLRRQGVTPTDRIAILAARSTALLPVVLGALKSGSAFSIIDPAQPTRKLATRLAELQAKAAIVVQQADPVPVLLEQCLSQLDVVFRYAIDESLPADSTQAPLVEFRPDNIAYIAFSKETPEQLPVEITHRSLGHLLDWQRTTFGLQPSDRFALLADLTSDTILRDILLPLLIGASLYVPNRTARSARLADWLTRKRITVCNLTNSLVNKLTEQLSEELPVPPLRRLFFADGPLLASQVCALREKLGRAELVVLYGSAESAFVAGYQVVPANGLLLENDVVPLGQGIDGFNLMVLNEHGQLAGIGELGEIYVRSPYLAQGYLHRPKLTARHFTMSRRFGRLWRTRDFGRIRPDGLIEYVLDEN